MDSLLSLMLNDLEHHGFAKIAMHGNDILDRG